MLAASARAGMNAATVGMTTSKKEAASVDTDTVAVVDTDVVAIPVRSDKALTIQNNLVLCSRHLVVRY